MGTRRIVAIIIGISTAILPRLTHAGADSDSLAHSGAIQADLSGARDFPVDVSWDVTLASKYLFLGVDYSDGEPVLQPELILGAKNFSFTLWMNHDLGQQHFNEFDFIFQYALELGPVSVAPGYAYFSYPNRPGWDPSQELMLELACAAPLNPSLRINHDFDAGDGTYFTLGVSQGLESLALPLSVGANVFYQDRYYQQTGFTAAEMNVSAGYVAGPFEIAPSISYFTTWDNGDFRGESAVPGTWHFAINVAQSF